MLYQRRISVFVGLALFAGILAAIPASNPAWAQAASGAMPAAVRPDEVVLSVGDRKFTAAEFETMTAALPPQFQAILASMGKKGFADELVSLLSLAMDGEKQQLHQSPEFERMAQFNRQVLLAQLAMSRIAEQYGTVGAEEVNYFYQTHQQDFEQAKVTGIYIPFAPTGSGASGVRTTSAIPQLTEQQAMTKALQLRARIQSGQNMTELAKTESQHPTAAKGGDFGFIARNAQAGPLPQNLVTAVFALQPSRVSAPLKDRSGYFIFRLEEKRVQPLEEIQDQIKVILGREKLSRHLEVLRQTYPVTMHPQYFSDAAPAAQGAPQPAR